MAKCKIVMCPCVKELADEKKLKEIRAAIWPASQQWQKKSATWKRYLKTVDLGRRLYDKSERERKVFENKEYRRLLKAARLPLKNWR